MLPFDLVPLNYVDSVEDAEAFLRWLGERRAVLGWDLESGGLRWHLPHFRLTLAQFADEDCGWAFQPSRFGHLLEKVMTEYKAPMVGHHVAGFDLHALKATGFSLPDRRNFHDTLIQSKLTRANKFDHSLDGLVKEYLEPAAYYAKHIMDDAFDELGLQPKSKNPEISERAWTEIARLGGSAFRIYSTADAVSVARLHSVMWPKVQAEYLDAYWSELGSWAETFEAEHSGLPVDLDWCEQYDAELEKDIVIVRTQLAELGVPEPSKRQKLATKLIEEGWVPKEFNRKSGKPKLNKAVLEGMDNEVVGPLLEWSRLTHWQNNYVRKVMKTSHNGRVFPHINVMQAKTGREAASNPPFHQLPSRHPDAHKVRRMVVAEPGMKIGSIDYQSQENRFTAHFSGDPLLNRIINEDLDIHLYNAAAIFDTPIGSVTPEQRAIAKTWSYAAGYGAQDPKLAAVIGVSVPEVATIRQRVNGAFTGVAEYSQRMEREATQMFNETGEAYIKTWMGRRVYIDVKRGRLQTTQVVNAPNQGGGADLLKAAMNRLAAADLSQYVILKIHDEVLVSVPPAEDGEEIVREIAKTMSFTNGEFNIDMTTSAGGLSDFWSGH